MTNKDEALKALRFISDNTVSYPNPYKQAEGLEEAFHIIERALTEAPKVDGPWGKQSKWRHVKTGNIYTVVGACRLEHSNSPAYLYMDKAGIIWARDKDEFLDGRFEPLDNHYDLVKKEG